MYTVIIFVCSLKTIRIRSFILIGGYIIDLHGHLCLYRNVCTIYIVYQHFNMSIPWLLWIFISIQSSVSQLCPVIEIRELKLKNNNKMKNCENDNINNFPGDRFCFFVF